jgi:hypothetical protein
LTIAAHEPEGTITVRSPANAEIVYLACCRARSAKPLLKNGWPQQVWAWGKSSSCPSRRSSATVALPVSGRSTSPRQVIIKESFMDHPI